MKLYKVFLSSVIAVLCSALIISTTFAIGIAPLRNNVDIEPGSQHTTTVLVENTENVPLTITLKKAIVIADGESKEYIDPTARPEIKDTPYSLIPYYSLNKDQTAVLDPGDSEEFEINLDIPSDITPGTYIGGIILEGKGVSETKDLGDVIGVTMKARVVHTLTVNVLPEGEKAMEDLRVDKFEVNIQSLKTGKFDFNVILTNKGNFSSIPIGTIKFYNAEDKSPVEAAFKEIEIIDNEVITKRVFSEVPFNQENSSITPNNTNTLTWSPDDRFIMNLKPGKYFAQLEAFYGVSGDSKIEATSPEFEIQDIIYVSELKPNQDSLFDSTINFTGEINNQGQSQAEGGGTITIRNIFGQTVDVINLGNLKILASNKYLVDETWEATRGLGLYNATLSYIVENNITENSVSFFFISWWQTGITLLIILLLIFGTIKGIKKYTLMKKKLEKVENLKE